MKQFRESSGAYDAPYRRGRIQEVGAKMSGAFIRRLTIERFRGIETLSWYPMPGVNIILGGGDVGKTTVLDAVGLLFSPSNYAVISDADYYGRDVESGFRIEAVVSLPPSSRIDRQAKPAWAWEWDPQRNDAVVPEVGSEGVTSTGDPVYRLRVEGTEELDLLHQIVQPDGSLDPLYPSVRRAIGLLRLGGDDRNDRDLRLVHGSVLDRLISDKGLRARVTRELASREVEGELREEAKQRLDALEAAFRKRALPSGLGLGVTGGQGASVGAMIGLTATREGVALPLASWGAGTRRVASLAIAEQTEGQFPIILVDEVERGLEPYRQRVLMGQLANRSSQAFLTTHSPAVISGADGARLWHMDASARIGALRGEAVTRQRRQEPEAFLARLAIVAEGATEVGFVRYLLERGLGARLEEYGVYVIDGGGQERSLALLGGLARGGVHFAGFLDTEEHRKHPKLWRDIEAQLGDLVFRWKQGCTEENVILVVPDDELEEFIKDPEDEKTGDRLRTLAERLGEEEKSFAHLREAAGDRLRAIVVEAATGRVPPEVDSATAKSWRKHGQRWFKSTDGGRELAVKLVAMQDTVSGSVTAEIRAFLDAIVSRARGSAEGGAVGG